MVPNRQALLAITRAYRRQIDRSMRRGQSERCCRQGAQARFVKEGIQDTLTALEYPKAVGTSSVGWRTRWLAQARIGHEGI
jgi:hypothetical protein